MEWVVDWIPEFDVPLIMGLDFIVKCYRLFFYTTCSTDDINNKELYAFHIFSAVGHIFIFI